MNRIGFRFHLKISRKAAIGFLILMLGMATMAAEATELVVTNCLDDGSAGNLRTVVAGALNGDVVSLGTLSCNVVQLTNGEIVIPQDDLSIAGAGAEAIAIDAGNASRVFNHGGSGTLTLTALTVRNGHVTSATEAHGGCILSAANVTLDHATVSSCTASGELQASGGGIDAAQTVHLEYSTVQGNIAARTGSAPATFPSAKGGGLSTADLSAYDSTISGNQATDNESQLTAGGGLAVGAQLFLRHSTVDHNNASYGGGIWAVGATTQTFSMCTISGNTASVAGGGYYGAGDLNLFSSTVAFNNGGSQGAGGIHSTSASQSHYVALTGTIIANNIAADNSRADVDADFPNSTLLDAEYSLIMHTAISTSTPGTLTSDPLLAALADNGGPTRTHALLPGSPALQSGYNNGLTCDQRHAPRGRNTDADIGAYEDQGDRVFGHDFDPCP
jgi:hypothetical protein